MNYAFDSVSMKSYEETIPRFFFPKNTRNGCCFIRLKVSEDKPVVLCAQLIGYAGISVTNAVEEIFVAVFMHLWEKKIFEIKTSKKILEHFFEDRYQARLKVIAWQYFVKKALWIEHYPAGTGVVAEGSYAIVGDAASNPFWSYVTLEKAAAQAGVEPGFLSVDAGNLTYAE